MNACIALLILLAGILISIPSSFLSGLGEYLSIDTVAPFHILSFSSWSSLSSHLGSLLANKNNELRNYRFGDYSRSNCDGGNDTGLCSFPIRHDGTVVFITDGAKGPARELALELASRKFGYYVLVGVKSEDERNTFMYESQKGIETIVFDIADPTTLVQVIYRLRYIAKNMNRDLAGVVINSLEYIRDHRNFISDEQRLNLVDVEGLDFNYKTLLKGPVRLIQAIIDLIHYQSMEKQVVEGNDNNETIVDHFATSNNNTLNLQALRILHLTGIEQSDECDYSCILQDTLEDIMDEIVQNATLSNFTIANIEENIADIRDGFSDSHGKSPRRRRRRKVRRTKEKRTQDKYSQLLSLRSKEIAELYGMNVSSEGKDKHRLKHTVNKMLHFFTSKHPLQFYPEWLELSKK